jgi:hypothetical protein
MALWPEIREGGWLSDILRDHLAVAYWTRKFDAVYDGEIDTWDYQWAFSCWIQRGLTVLPTVNLVQNIGFADDATHTRNSGKDSLPAQDLKYPLSHPPYVIRDETADSWTQRIHLGYGALRLGDRFRRILRR